ncbi:MAG: site-specific DNA-methyltransferase [Candidatus Eisenbacteria sp.]|nr:site-specific DNA-methyltransferase [Candidatus Eisenbacteria bacterium]
METDDHDRLLVEGDNLAFMSALPAGIVDLIVTDPPFFTGRRRIISPRPAGADAAHSTPGFDDQWKTLADYLAFMRPRLEAIRRLLRPKGSLVIHLDWRVVHAVRLELDEVFGPDRFVNEIIWHYTGGGRARRYFSRKHDTLLWYARGDSWTFNIDAVRVPYKATSGFARGGITARSGKHYSPHPAGTPLDDVWDLPIINPLSPERCGYPTQKPELLLERIVLALSRPGDLVVDPFCGSGTSVVVAARHGRRWCACDCSPQAIAIARRRLERETGGRPLIGRRPARREGDRPQPAHPPA